MVMNLIILLKPLYPNVQYVMSFEKAARHTVFWYLFIFLQIVTDKLVVIFFTPNLLFKIIIKLSFS
jgi:hypothetical protein